MLEYSQIFRHLFLLFFQKGNFFIVSENATLKLDVLGDDTAFPERL